MLAQYATAICAMRNMLPQYHHSTTVPGASGAGQNFPLCPKMTYIPCSALPAN
ncbi:MAG: hypothetical protein LIP03_06275 [Bacteroidales bacterium]|nr:hypothetical protein [Bacteroidales bacterium]